MAHTDADSLDEFNTVLSNVRVGEMVFTPVTVQ